MPSLQTALPPELADNVIRLYRECLRRAKFIGHQMYTKRGSMDKNKAIVEYLNSIGMIKPNKVAEVLESVGTELFVANKISSYDDHSSPIGFEGTISASQIHATCLDPQEGHQGMHILCDDTGLQLTNTTQKRWCSQYSRQRDLDDGDRSSVCNYDSSHVFNKKTNSSFKLSRNWFANMPNKEFRRTYVRHRKLHGSPSHEFPFEKVCKAPDSADERAEGAMTEGKNQGKWGSESQRNNMLSAEDSLRGLYEKWCRYYLRTVDYDYRFSVFKSKYEYVNAFNNNPNNLFKVGLGLFSDMTTDEVNRRYHGRRLKDIGETDEDDGFRLPASNSTEISVPTTIDEHQRARLANNEVALMKSVGEQPESVAVEASGSQFQIRPEGVFAGKVWGSAQRRRGVLDGGA